MTRRFICVLLVLAVIILLISSIACQKSTEPEPKPTPSPIATPNNPDGGNSSDGDHAVTQWYVPEEDKALDLYEPDQSQWLFDPEKYTDVTYIVPSEVFVEGIYPGARAEHPFSVHNGEDSEQQFEIRVVDPATNQKGYAPLPRENYDWIVVSSNRPVISSMTTEHITVALVIPEDADSLSDKFEFWMGAAGGKGFIQIQLCSKWLVTMK